MDRQRIISSRAQSLDVQGIRRIFEQAASLNDPINLTIGQPDFPVPDAVKRAACDAIHADRNGYTITRGIPELRSRIVSHLRADLGWDVSENLATHEDPERPSVFVTSGTSGALVLCALSMLNAGDEMIIPDPWFVLYPALAKLVGAKAVPCDTYPDFKLTAERVEPLITERTKFVICVSPGNPTGVTMTAQECRDLLDLCRAKGVVLISDEIYDEFAFSEALDPSPERGRKHACPSPARFDGAERDVVVIRGFGKTYACTGWRMGYVCGPGWLVSEMVKMQQYTYVCAPSMAQWACREAFDVDPRPMVEVYEKRRDMVIDALGDVCEIFRPGGAFYCFIRIPERLGLTGEAFVKKMIEKNVLVSPGGVYSRQDTPFRLSFAVEESRLRRGLELLRETLAG
ncbi:MAG: pyridoxal phosphate-dependent aminotransferase [Phycisphaerales bacterium]